MGRAYPYHRQRRDHRSSNFANQGTRIFGLPIPELLSALRADPDAVVAVAVAVAAAVAVAVAVAGSDTVSCCWCTCHMRSTDADAAATTSGQFQIRDPATQARVDAAYAAAREMLSRLDAEAPCVR